MEYVIPVMYTRRAIGIHLSMSKQAYALYIHRRLDPKCRTHSALPYPYLAPAVDNIGITKCSTYRCTTLAGLALSNNNSSYNNLIVIASCSIAQHSIIEHSHNSTGSSLYSTVLVLQHQRIHCPSTQLPYQQARVSSKHCLFMQLLQFQYSHVLNQGGNIIGKLKMREGDRPNKQLTQCQTTTCTTSNVYTIPIGLTVSSISRSKNIPFYHHCKVDDYSRTKKDYL